MRSVRPGMKDEDIALELGWVLFSGAWVDFLRPGVKGEDGVLGAFCSPKGGGLGHCPGAWVSLVRPRGGG